MIKIARQLAKDSRAPHKAVRSLGHRVVKPTQMYRTQTASIANV